MPKTRVTVVLSEKYAGKGRPNNPLHGPVCMAVRDAVSDDMKAQCVVEQPTADTLFINGRQFWLPTDVQKFTQAHDRGRAPTPCAFVLELDEDLFKPSGATRK